MQNKTGDTTPEQKIDNLLTELRAHSEKHHDYIFNNAVYGFLTTLDDSELEELSEQLTLGETPQKDFFNVVRLHRDDILMKLDEGFDGVATEAQKQRVRDLTDDEMEHLASRIGDTLMDGGDFWMAIEFFLDDNNYFKLEPHNGTTCPKYNEPVLPDENGNCSLCGAELEAV